MNKPYFAKEFFASDMLQVVTEIIWCKQGEEVIREIIPHLASGRLHADSTVAQALL